MTTYEAVLARFRRVPSSRASAPAAAASAALPRRLGAWGAGAFVVCNMVGAGIFTVPKFVRASTGSALSALSVWAAGGLVALCGALCYAELATRMPRAGGEYHYLRRTYGGGAGFVSGTVSFVVGFAAAMAAAALGAVAYLGTLIPAWDPTARTAGVEHGALAAAGLVLLAAALHSRGVGLSGRLQAMIAGLVVATIAAFVVLGFGSGRGSLAALTAGDGLGPAHGGWWIAFLQVSFAYSGWNAAAYLAEEADAPRRTLPRALVGGTLVVTAIYMGLNAVFFYALPDATWGGSIAVGRDAAARLFGADVAAALSGLVALAIFGSVSAMAAAGPRVYFAMARDGLAPALAARLSPRNGTPLMAIWAQATLAALLALTGAFEALLVYIGSALLLFAAAAVLALLVQRRREARAAGDAGNRKRGGAPVPSRGVGDEASRRERCPDREAASREGCPDHEAGSREHCPDIATGSEVFRVPGGALAPLLFLSAALLAWGNGLRQQPVPTLAALATVAAGGVLYAVARRRGWVRRSSCNV